MFGSATAFEAWSPDASVRRAGVSDIQLVMVTGTMDATHSFAERFRPAAEESLASFTHIDADCPHSLFCMLDAHADDVFPVLGTSIAPGAEGSRSDPTLHCRS